METFNDNPKVLCDPVPLPPTISLIQHVSLAFPLQPPATLDSLVSVNMLSTPCSSSSSPHTPGFFPAFGWAQRSPAWMGCPLGPPFPIEILSLLHCAVDFTALIIMCHLASWTVFPAYLLPLWTLSVSFLHVHHKTPGTQIFHICWRAN